MGVPDHTASAGYDADLTGYSVAAIDGDIGHLDQATDELLGRRTWWWTPGRGSSAARCVPAGEVNRIDTVEHKVYATGPSTRSRPRPSTAVVLVDGEDPAVSFPLALAGAGQFVARSHCPYRSTLHDRSYAPRKYGGTDGFQALGVPDRAGFTGDDDDLTGYSVVAARFDGDIGLSDEVDQ